MIPRAQPCHRTVSIARMFKHPRLMHYYRLIALVLLVNGALLAWHRVRADLGLLTCLPTGRLRRTGLMHTDPAER